ncbi:hypothetical protein K461DRAFT_80622 [Myriangium duriaei CBS 260.36]|uniref:Uncharacterized protein n=1 Tax=Myriangium duriaei CBS 260.36 TaxID=1168546 RepID=A0A9P4MK01_9PEZI|nr:hypothetical protein K461DRAFT_80622 [Myriangium duriaei CBS 260.36]
MSCPTAICPAIHDPLRTARRLHPDRSLRTAPSPLCQTPPLTFPPVLLRYPNDLARCRRRLRRQPRRDRSNMDRRRSTPPPSLPYHLPLISPLGLRVLGLLLLPLHRAPPHRHSTLLPPRPAPDLPLPQAPHHRTHHLLHPLHHHRRPDRPLAMRLPSAPLHRRRPLPPPQPHRRPLPRHPPRRPPHLLGPDAAAHPRRADLPPARPRQDLGFGRGAARRAGERDLRPEDPV